MEDLEELRKDYKRRKKNKALTFTRCSNCIYFQNGFYHNECRIKERIIEWHIQALVCRYYKRIKMIEED